MTFYKSGGLRLHYVCRGATPSQSSATFIFQHDIGGDLRQASRFLSPERTSIPEGELAIVHADFRAHGRSEMGPPEALSIDALAGDLVALLDHVHLERAIVGGISLGAAVALRLAAQHPERCRALVLCRPAWVDGGMNLVARHALGVVADLLASDDWQHSAASLLEPSEIPRYLGDVSPVAARELRAHVQTVLARPDTRGAAIARLRALPWSRGLNDAGELAAVSCPTLILASCGDPLHPFDYAGRLARSLPQSHLVELTSQALDDRARRAEIDRAIGDFLRVVLHGDEGTCLYPHANSQPPTPNS